MLVKIKIVCNTYTMVKVKDTGKPRKVTSFKLDADLVKQLKVYAIQNDVAMSDLLENAIRTILKTKPPSKNPR